MNEVLFSITPTNPPCIISCFPVPRNIHQANNTPTNITCAPREFFRGMELRVNDCIWNCKEHRNRSGRKVLAQTPLVCKICLPWCTLLTANTGLLTDLKQIQTRCQTQQENKHLHNKQKNNLLNRKQYLASIVTIIAKCLSAL